jgi:hypothetical protein
VAVATMTARPFEELDMNENVDLSEAHEAPAEDFIPANDQTDIAELARSPARFMNREFPGCSSTGGSWKRR